MAFWAEVCRSTTFVRAERSGYTSPSKSKRERSACEGCCGSLALESGIGGGHNLQWKTTGNQEQECAWILILELVGLWPREEEYVQRQLQELSSEELPRVKEWAVPSVKYCEQGHLGRKEIQWVVSRKDQGSTAVLHRDYESPVESKEVKRWWVVGHGPADPAGASHR